jgi:hypothetical protein
MPKYGNKAMPAGRQAQEEVKEAMHDYKHGKLRMKGGKVVKSRKQAIAIGLSEAREEGGKVPPKTAE